MTPTEKAQVRNDTIDELCNWLDSCIEAVNHEDNVYRACKAMVTAMRGKKSPDDTRYPDEQHYPLNRTIQK